MPSPTPHILVVSPNERTLRFPIKLLVGTQTVETTALVDSGATGNFIDLGQLSLANFPLKKLPQPIGAFNVDGTPNQRGTILWKAYTRMVLPHGSDDLCRSHGRQPRTQPSYSRNALAEVQKPSHRLEEQHSVLLQIPRSKP